MAKCTGAFSYDDEKDADIAAWLADLDERGANKSAEIRAAIRTYKDTAGLTLGDILNELGTIKRMLRAGVTVHNGEAGDPGPDQEPTDPLAQEAQAALNTLGGLG